MRTQLVGGSIAIYLYACPAIHSACPPLQLMPGRRSDPLRVRLGHLRFSQEHDSQAPGKRKPLEVHPHVGLGLTEDYRMQY